MIVNLILDVKSFNSVLNKELQRKATLFATAFSVTVSDYIDQPYLLNQKITKTVSEESLVKEITAYRYDGDIFNAIATTNPEKELSILNKPASSLAWKEKHSVAYLDVFGSDKVWTVIMPIKNSAGEYRALLVAKMSTTDIDVLTKQTATQTLVILSVTIFIIMLLLINHYRFVGFAKLFYKLREVTKIRDRFIYHAAHDLQTPAVTIRNYSANLTQDPNLNESQKESINTIHIASSNMIGMTKNLIDLSQLEDGTIKLNKRLSNPASIAQLSITDTSNLAKDRGVLVSLEVSAVQGLCLTDADKLRLSLNAIFNTMITQMTHGKIIVTYKPSDSDDWIIVITSLDFQPVLKSLTESQTYIPRGVNQGIDYGAQMGIGYWVAEETIRLMGGRIITDYEPGQGTNIYIIFKSHHVVKYPDDPEALPPSTK